MDLAKADQSVREIPHSRLSDCRVPVFRDGDQSNAVCFFFVCVCTRWEATGLQELLVPSRGFHAHECQRKELPAPGGWQPHSTRWVTLRALTLCPPRPTAVLYHPPFRHEAGQQNYPRPWWRCNASFLLHRSCRRARGCSPWGDRSGWSWASAVNKPLSTTWEAGWLSQSPLFTLMEILALLVQR